MREYELDLYHPYRIPDSESSRPDVRIERDPQGAEWITVEPPELSRDEPRWDWLSNIRLPFGTLELTGHMQAKQVGAEVETGAAAYKNGSGDHIGFTVIRKPGLFTLALTTAQDGLTAAWEDGWKRRLSDWGIHAVHPTPGRTIALDQPDVAFSTLLRGYPGSKLFTDWKDRTVSALGDALAVDLSLIEPDTIMKIGFGDEEAQDALFARTILATRTAMDRMVLSTARYRTETLWSHHYGQPTLPSDDTLFDWYVNGPFATAGILIIEPLLLSPRRILDEHVVELSRYGATILIENRSRADTMAFAGPLEFTFDDGFADTFMAGHTWFGDPNSHTDWLIQILRQQGLSPEVIEAELLKKPQLLYATYPSDSIKRHDHALRATTYQHIRAETPTTSDIAFALTDGMTHRTRNPVERMNWTDSDIMSNLGHTIHRIRDDRFGAFMDERGFTTDDRSLGAVVYRPLSFARIADLENSGVVTRGHRP